MLFSARTSLGPILLLGWLLAAGAAPAATSGVEDKAGFFSAATVQTAQDEIKEIKRRFNKDLLIETFPSVPADRQAGQNLKDEAVRDRVFKKWAEDRVREVPVHGVYVLITRSPGRIEVGVSQDTVKNGFTAEDRKKLTQSLFEKFKANQRDEGLLDAVRFVRDALAKNLPPRLVANVVKDDGKFFTPEAVRRADGELETIHRKTGKNIIFETFPRAPANDLQRVKEMNPEDRNRYYENRMKSRAQNTPFCVYVLITKEPPHVQVALGQQAEGSAFTVKSRNELNEILRTSFREKNFDQGLAKATDYIRKTLHVDLAARPTPTAPATTRTGSVTAPDTKKAVAATTPDTRQAAGTAIQAKGSSELHPATSPDTQKGVSGVATVGGDDNPPESKKGGFNPMWILWIALGLLGLWILYGIIRGLTHRPQMAGGYPPPGQGYGAAPGQGYGAAAGAQPPAPGQQVGPHYAAGQPVHPQGAPGYAPGYGPGYGPAQPMGGYGPGMPYGGGGGGRGGGFLTGMIGGMFGAAAGSWVYDSFFRGPHTQTTGGGFGSQAHGGQPAQYNNPPQTGGSAAGPAAGAAAGGFSSTGGDFDDASNQPVETSGADFDAGDNQGDTGAGGDFGESSTADTGAGGDFGSDENTGSGGDFGSEAEPDRGGGGDFGGADTSGGDAGGGDFGGGGDSGGDGGGGDF